MCMKNKYQELKFVDGVRTIIRKEEKFKVLV